MKTVVIIQARVGSTRLPGKVLIDLCGKTGLGHVIARVRACPLVDEMVVATTESAADVAIVQECKRRGIKVFRGSEADVLDRYYQAARTFGADMVVRVTSDCPLYDPTLLEEMLRQYYREWQKGRGPDYFSTGLKRTYPRGLDTEIMTFAALEKAHEEATQGYEREHVTPYIIEHPQLFNLQAKVGDTDLSSLRWTLDTEDDLALLKEIYAALYQEGKLFSTNDVLALLERRPELAMINVHVEQKKLDA